MPKKITSKPTAAAPASPPPRPTPRRGKAATATAAVPPVPIPAPPITKQDAILSLLRRPQGADIAEMMQATGWMSHSVRGLLSAVVKRKLGLALVSEPDAERGRVYRIGAPARDADAGPAARKTRSRRAPQDTAGARAGA